MSKTIKETLPQLEKEFNIMVTEAILKILYNKGFELSSVPEMNDFFRDRIKSNTFEGITTMTIDNIEFMAYKRPKFKKHSKDINIKLEYTEL